MTQILPWVAVALAAAALLAREGSRARPEEEPSAFWKDLGGHGAIFFAMGGFAALALVSGWRWDEKLPGYMPASWGLAFGLAIAALAYIAEISQARALAGAAIPMALGLAAAGVMGMGDKASMLPTQLGWIAGAGLGAWMLSLRTAGQVSWWPAISAAFGSAALACNYLGLKGPGEKASESGLAFGLAAVLAGLVAAGLARAMERSKGDKAGLFVVLASALLLLGGTIIGQRYLYLRDTWQIFGFAVVTALVINWFMPDTRRTNALRFLIAAVAWIALGTIAFGLRKGYGMSVALLGGMSMLVLLGNRRALMTLGPLLALVMFRVFREIHPDAYRAIDIGQHYAVIGLLLGASLTLIPIEWSRILKPGSGDGNTAGAAFLWMLLLVGLLPAAAILLGAKGLVGLVAGLGIGAFIEGMRGGASLHALSLGASFAAIAAISYGWLGEQLDKTRDDKLGVLYSVVAALIIIALIIAWVSPRQEDGIEPAI